MEYRIGRMYAAGLGTEQDALSAADWLTRSAEQDHKYAQYSFAGSYARGEGGQIHAQYELGELYRDGRGVEKDALLAAAWFARAAAVPPAPWGSPPADRRRGASHRTGRPPPDGFLVRLPRAVSTTDIFWTIWMTDRPSSPAPPGSCTTWAGSSGTRRREEDRTGRPRSRTASSVSGSGKRKWPWGISRMTMRRKRSKRSDRL